MRPYLLTIFDVVFKTNLDVKIAKDESEVATCMRLRRAVFIKEQNVAEHEEVDGQERWSQDFGPVVKVDQLVKEMIQNDETKEPLA
jgi:predicted GNAT family N-acyltransferase